MPNRKLIYTDTSSTVGSNSSICSGLPTALLNTAALDFPPLSALRPVFASSSVGPYVSGSHHQFTLSTPDTISGIQKLHRHGPAPGMYSAISPPAIGPCHG